MQYTTCSNYFSLRSISELSREFFIRVIELAECLSMLGLSMYLLPNLNCLTKRNLGTKTKSLSNRQRNNESTCQD